MVWLMFSVYGVCAQSVTLTGVVRDANDAAISGALVRLLPAGQSRERSVVADANGRYEFTGLGSGTYRLTVSANGFALKTEAVEIAAVNLTLNISLQTAVLSENVVISATRTPESLATIPGGVTVLTQQQVLANTEGPGSLNDALGKLVPGLAPGSQGSTIFGQTLRGRAPLIIIDGIPQITTRNGARDLATVEPAMIDRIEVIRGASAIYGEGATGGIINITTKDADTSGRLRFSTNVGFGNSLTHPGGSFSPFVRQSLTGKYDQLDYLFGGSFEKVGGYFDADGDRIVADPFAQGGPSDTRAYSLNFKLGYDHTATQRSQIALFQYRAVQDTEYGSDPAVNTQPLRSVKSRPLKGLDQDEPQQSNNIQMDYRYGNQRLFGSPTQLNFQLYRRQFLTRYIAFDGRPFGPAFGGKIIQSYIDSKKTGGRVLFDSPVRSWGLTAVYGLDHVIEHTSQPVSFLDPVAWDATRSLRQRIIGGGDWVPLMKPRNTGAFLQLEWSRFEKLVLRAGVRQEWIRFRVPDFTTLGGNRATGGLLSYNGTLVNVGLVYGFTSAFSVFGNFSQGFSAPDVGLTLRNAPNNSNLSAIQYAAQKVDNWELGTRGNWSAVQTSLSLFYSKSKLGTSISGFGTPILRAPEKVYGLEATLDLQPVKKFNVGGTLTWLEGKVDPTSRGNFVFLNSYRIPPVKVTAHVQHQTTERWSNRIQVLHSGNRARFGASVRFGELSLRDYTVTDFYSSVRLSRGSLRVGIENLFNRLYFPRDQQLLRGGNNQSYSPATGATLNVGYTINY
jgi:iron complex outermembrane receptor protein